MQNGKVGLWRLTFSHAKGAHWLLMRTCNSDTAESWKAVYEKDDAQGVVYFVGDKAPKLIAGDRERSRFLVTM